MTNAPSRAAHRRIVGDALVAAAAALRERRGPDALAILLGTWRDVAAAPLADAIDALGHRAARARAEAPVPQVGGSDAEARRAWREIAAARRPEDVDALLASWLDVPAAEAAGRAELLRELSPDPRRDRAVLAVLHDTPNRTTIKFWTQMCGLVEGFADPRQLDALRAIPALHARVLTTQGGSRIAQRVAAAIDAVLPRVAAAAVDVAPLDEPASRALAELVAPPDDRPAAVADHAERIDALHAQILADPHDLTLRRVYADALADHGDARAELISLSIQQHDAPLDKTGRKRYRELLKAHLPALLGPLDKVVYRTDLELHYGFLGRCTVNTERPHLVDDVVGHPLWATVVDLHGPSSIFLHPVMRSLRRLRLMGGVFSDDDVLDALLDAPSPPPIDTLALVVRPSTIERLARCVERLPTLRHLRAYSCNADTRALLDSPLLAQLSSLWIDLPWLWRRWAAALRAAPCAVDDITLFAKTDRGTVELRFGRAADGTHRAVDPAQQRFVDEALGVVSSGG